MLSNSHTRKLFIVALTIIVVVPLFIAGAQYVLAEKNLLTTAGEKTSNLPNLADDDQYDYTFTWINNLPGFENDSDYNDDACFWLHNQLYSIGWSGGISWEHPLADQGFKRYECNGNEDEWVDDADLSMLCSRTSVFYDTFFNQFTSVVLFNRYDYLEFLSPGCAYKSYGDRDLEWLAVAGSNLLTDAYSSDWATTMNGIHLLLGFKTQFYEGPSVSNTIWGNYMLGQGNCTLPNKITQSWFRWIDDLQPADTCARVLAERDDSFNDFLWGIGYVSEDDPLDDYYSYLDHCSTGPASKELLHSYDQPEVLAMPIVQVIDRVVDEDYVMNMIAPAFEMQAADPCFVNKIFGVFKISEGMTYTLQVDQVTGSFSYQNLSTLWTKPVITPTLPNDRIADYIINNWFLDTPAKNLPGANFRNAGYEYMTEDIVGMNPKSGQTGDTQGQLLTDLPIDVSMTYPRVISVTARTTGGEQVVDIPVLGPGGHMKVYLGDQGEIIGAQGGSRDVQVTNEMVNILDAKAVWSMFIEDPSLAIGDVSLVADTITHTVPTLGYYEMPYIVPQDELIPVWEFRAYFYMEGNLVAGDVPIYLPAATEYMPPQVNILNPPDGSIFWASEPISFEGVISGGTRPYTIKWTSANSGYLGDTITLVTSLTSPIQEGTVFPDEISLQVTDANGLAGADNISVMIKPVFWMPFVNK